MFPANELARKHPFILNCKLEPLRWAKLAVRGRLPLYTWNAVLSDLKRNTGTAPHPLGLLAHPPSLLAACVQHGQITAEGSCKHLMAYSSLAQCWMVRAARVQQAAMRPADTLWGCVAGTEESCVTAVSGRHIKFCEPNKVWRTPGSMHEPRKAGAGDSAEEGDSEAADEDALVRKAGAGDSAEEGGGEAADEDALDLEWLRVAEASRREYV